MEVTELSELLEPRDIKPERSCGFDDPEHEDSLSTHFNNETALSMMAAPTEILQPLETFEAAPDEDTTHSTDSTEDVIVQLMDIRTRLSTLRGMLERRIGADLSHYTFWLQDAKELESHKTLVDQCIKGEGVVQVNVQLKPHEHRINILDVLKPDEELVDLAPPLEEQDGVESVEETSEEPSQDTPAVAGEGDPEKRPPLHSTMVKWIVDEQFQSDRARLKIPEEPASWTVAHVKLWIQWAVRQFNLTGIKLSDWSISGEQLSAMTLPEFRRKCPSDPGDIFWTHFELLRKCKFIAVVQNEEPGSCKDAPPSQSPPERQFSVKKRKPTPAQAHVVDLQMTAQMISPEDLADYNRVAARSFCTGQIHLWQFLLELLTTADHLPIIQWHGTEGEFKLCDPERVAHLWGTRKHKPAMNYEKLSRALRYYYDGDMIAKVNGKRFVYKFVCDLRQLVGYSAGELSRLVTQTYRQENGAC